MQKVPSFIIIDKIKLLTADKSKHVAIWRNFREKKVVANYKGKNLWTIFWRN
jgi:hypothetical protein